MWSILRNKKLSNYKFYRQFPIGKYIVDFCCRSEKIIIEIDGGGHNYPKQAAEDIIRDDFLKSRDYKVIRIWSNEVENNIDGVVERIITKLEKEK